MDATAAEKAKILVAAFGSVAAAARETGIPRRTLRDWLGDKAKRRPSAVRTEDVRGCVPPRIEAKVDNSSVLVLPDLHAPYAHPDAVAFLCAVRDAIGATRCVSVGDETDFHALSFHDSDPDLDSAGRELESARVFLRRLEREFPVLELVESNHGALPFRRAHAHGMPSRLVRSYREILFGETDENGDSIVVNGRGALWRWSPQLRIELPGNRVAFVRHTYGADIVRVARENGACLIQGHHHGLLEARHATLLHGSVWALSVGCLIDPTHSAFNYGRASRIQPALGCGAIVGGEPIAVKMPLDEHGRWTGKLPIFGA
jgi:hypothetical protein